MKYLIYASIFLLITGRSFCQSNTISADSLLRTYYHDNEPGAFVIISKNGKTVFQNGYGFANLQTREKISISTNFNIGSVSKQFNAFCILQLAEKKKLSLTDKLEKFFPDFNKKVGSIITVQQLLTHSSGIIDHYAFVDTNIVKHATDKDILNAVKNIDSTYFAAGTKFQYSNTAYCLLALIVEKISGMPYNEYIKKNIFTPLAMQHSLVLQIGKPISNQAHGYEYDSSKNTFTKLDADESIFFSTEGDGGVYTNAVEYMHWLWFLQNPPAADKAAIQKARSAQFSIDPVNKLSYGYGWFINEKDKEKAVYHSGSNGGFRAFVFSIPSKNYFVTIFSNRTGIDLEKLVQQINKIEAVY